MASATLTGQATEVEKSPADLILEAADEYRRAEGTGPRWEGVASAWSRWDDLSPGEMADMLRWLPGARTEGVNDHGAAVAFVALVTGCVEGEPIRGARESAPAGSPKSRIKTRFNLSPRPPIDLDRAHCLRLVALDAVERWYRALEQADALADLCYTDDVFARRSERIGASLKHARDEANAAIIAAHQAADPRGISPFYIVDDDGDMLVADADPEHPEGEWWPWEWPFETVRLSRAILPGRSGCELR